MSRNKSAEHSIPLDFDEWMTLAKNDPDKFEEKRRKRIESFFNNVPEEKLQRLKGLQWQIDQTRKLADNPMASCIAISNMMWDSVTQLQKHQYELVNLATGAAPRAEKKKPVSAKILPLHPSAH
jgi:hypothetical protein